MKKLFYTVMLLLCLSIVGCQKEGEDVKVSSISLNMTSVSLTAGSSATLVATVSPSNATNKKVVWMSSNASVASVNNGTVTAIAEGEATITVISEDSGASATCKLTVTKSGSDVPVPPSPAASARLTRVVIEYASGGHNVEDVKYDDKDRVISRKGGEVFGYKSNITFSYNDALNQVTLSSLDQDGKVGGSIVLNLDENGLYRADGFSYFNGHLISCKVSNVYEYRWENDCLVSFSWSGGSGNDFTYYSIDNPFYGKSFDPFIGDDDLFPIEYCWGLCGPANKKLKKHSNYDDYEYSFSSAGRITEMLVYHENKLYAHYYFYYEDETPGKPRDEHTETVPSELLGDWVITGYIDDGKEKIYEDYLFGSNLGVSIFSIGQNSAIQHSADYNEKKLSYSNGILYGVDASSIEKNDEKYNIHEYDFVYKSGNIYNIYGVTGEWDKPCKVEIVSQDKFYYQGWDFPRSFRDNIMYIYERVKEIKN